MNVITGKKSGTERIQRNNQRKGNPVYKIDSRVFHKSFFKNLFSFSYKVEVSQGLQGWEKNSC